jgi:hypothetical protein
LRWTCGTGVHIEVAVEGVVQEWAIEKPRQLLVDGGRAGVMFACDTCEVAVRDEGADPGHVWNVSAQ